MSLTLHVTDGTTVFKYSGDVLARTEASFLEEATDETIEAGSIELRLNNPDFMGVTNFENLLAGPFRALVFFTFDDPSIGVQTIVDGRIHRSEVTWIPSLQSWIIIIIDDSIDEFFARLENKSVLATGDFVDVTTNVVDSGGGFTASSRRWYDIKDMFLETIDGATGIDDVFLDFQSVRQWFNLDIVYDDLGTDRTISRELPLYVSFQPTAAPVQLPPWNCAQLWDILRALLGWRVRCEFAGFPGNDITATILTDTFPQPVQPAPEIDNLEQLDGRLSQTFIQAQIEDFALSYSNKIDDEPLHASFTVQTKFAIYSAIREEIDPDGTPANRGLQKVKLTLPDVGSQATLVADTPDPTNHPNYTEDVVYGIPSVKDTDNVYLAAIQNITGPGNRMVESRVPTNPAVGQIAAIAEHWALSLINNFVLSISTLFKVNGTIEFSTLTDPSVRPIVGDPLEGLRYRSFHWMLRSIEWFPAENVADVDLIRPEDTPIVVLDLPTVCPPQNLTVFPPEFTPPDGVRLEWQTPAINCGEQLPSSYDVKVKLPGDVFFTFLANVTALFFDTGDMGAGFGIYEFCVQSKTAGGAFSICAFVSALGEP